MTHRWLDDGRCTVRGVQPPPNISMGWAFHPSSRPELWPAASWMHDGTALESRCDNVQFSYNRCHLRLYKMLSYIEQNREIEHSPSPSLIIPVNSPVCVEGACHIM